MCTWAPNYPYYTSAWNLNFSPHALKRMRQLHIHPLDVMLVLTNGEWQYASNRAIRYAFDGRRTSARALDMARHAGIDDVVVVIARRTCRIITVYRLWGYDGWLKVLNRPRRSQSDWHDGRGH